MRGKAFLLFLCMSITGVSIAHNSGVIYKSETLKIKKNSENTFLHISYLNTVNYGKVACNGLIVIDNGEALIIDTPVSKIESKELINWIRSELKCKPIGVIATHFHIDCLGGIIEFHNEKISSYASFETIKLAKLKNTSIPNNGFNNYLEIKVGNETVVNEFLGEGHTSDNIVCYFPKEKVLFGGCLIKPIGAGKGNLKDANVNDWSKTVEEVQSKYGDAEIIIPGHGEVGELDLLNYTIELFRKND